eukprot:108215_1
MTQKLCSVFLFALGTVSGVFCRYGGWEDINGTCMLNCEYNGLYLQISELSFESIKNTCYNIKDAAEFNPTECNSLDDLIYTDESCTCPYCKCSTNGNEIINQLQYVKKSCENCTCGYHQYYDDIEDLIYQCDNLIYSYDQVTWNDYQCPPKICTTDVLLPKSVAQGEGWWADVDDPDTECSKYCYCAADGQTQCVTGFDTIYANEKIKNEFINRCHLHSTDCMDDPSRMFTTNTGPRCSGHTVFGCPKCDCGSHEIGEIWYTEYSKHSSTSALCIECTCVKDSSTDITYAECRNLINTYTKGLGTCDIDNNPAALTCHSQSLDSQSVETLEEITCNKFDPIGYSSIYSFCKWKYDIDAVIPYTWGCAVAMDGLICEAFANGECIYYNTTVSVLPGILQDCSSSMYTLEGYQYCCKSGDNCNHENIELNSCKRSVRYEELIQQYDSCVTDVYEKYQCNNDMMEITCDGLSEYYNAIAKCRCKRMYGFFEKVSSETKVLLQEAITTDFQTYSEWNTVLGCDIGFTCDLSSGGTVTMVDSTDDVRCAFYFVAMWFSINVYIIM